MSSVSSRRLALALAVLAIAAIPLLFVVVTSIMDLSSGVKTHETDVADANEDHDKAFPVRDDKDKLEPSGVIVVEEAPKPRVEEFEEGPKPREEAEEGPKPREAFELLPMPNVEPRPSDRK